MVPFLKAVGEKGHIYTTLLRYMLSGPWSLTPPLATIPLAKYLIIYKVLDFNTTSSPKRKQPDFPRDCQNV